MILEVVLSTDGVEPLYFITPEDLTYQARCHEDQLKGSNKYKPFSEDSKTDVVEFSPYTDVPKEER